MTWATADEQAEAWQATRESLRAKLLGVEANPRSGDATATLDYHEVTALIALLDEQDVDWRTGEPIDECLAAGRHVCGPLRHEGIVVTQASVNALWREYRAAIRREDTLLERAAQLVEHSLAGMEPPDGGSPTLEQRFANIAAAIRGLTRLPQGAGGDG